MKTDGGLRTIFQKHLPHFHWQSVETGQTGRGIPDLNYCFAGREGWIELKQTTTGKIDMRPEQIAWIERRMRAGGTVWAAVRFKHDGGPRKGPAVDELWLITGIFLREWLTKGRAWNEPHSDGPAKWNWESIERDLLS